MISDDLHIVMGQLAQALALPPPPPLEPDGLPSQSSVISQLLGALATAGNVGDPTDMAAAEAGYDERELRTAEALTAFPANEEQSAQAMQQVMGMAQQVPQSLTGAGQGVGGVFGGFFQQLNEGLQQAMQVGQQLAGGIGDDGQGAELLGELPSDVFDGSLGAGGAIVDAGGTAAQAGGAPGGTAPSRYPGPPAPVSASTFPASSAGTPPPSKAPESPEAGRGAAGGYPMMPAGAMGGTSGKNDAKAETKRVVPPSVRNGGPVQGGINRLPKLPEVTKRVDGKLVASRRIQTPGDPPDEAAEAER